jgi:hypothetical protein
MIFGKVIRDYGKYFSLKVAANSKIYTFNKIMFYDKNFNTMESLDITDMEVCFLEIDFNKNDNQLRVINFKDKDFFLQADYLQSFRAEIKEIDVDEEEFKKKLKDMGAISYDDFKKMMGN